MSSNKIEFVFQNKVHQILNPDPNETVLNFVRSNLKKTGTKEGCAEGGCGACTIVLGELISYLELVGLLLIIFGLLILDGRVLRLLRGYESNL